MEGRIQRIGILAGFFLLALVNCGGGGGGGDDSGGGGVLANFAANCLNSDPCASGAVTSQKGVAAGNIVEVELWLNKLNTTIGEASLDLSFDPTVVDYQGYTEGSALGDPNNASDPTVYLVSEPQQGEVLVDISPPSGGKSISSPAIMVRLTFKMLKTTA
ncbi:MAG TPA: cohesin domain-containing protein, partial [Candidatus Polarisedimenticolia bacterium]|nr:cohesin domain-containing protein [Candidatus Polarisedimenticolia bacterium]